MRGLAALKNWGIAAGVDGGEGVGVERPSSDESSWTTLSSTGA
jgi:hypothetical protein